MELLQRQPGNKYTPPPQGKALEVQQQTILRKSGPPFKQCILFICLFKDCFDQLLPHTK